MCFRSFVWRSLKNKSPETTPCPVAALAALATRAASASVSDPVRSPNRKRVGNSIFSHNKKENCHLWGPPRIHYTHVYPCIKICSSIFLYIHTVYTCEYTYSTVYYSICSLHGCGSASSACLPTLGVHVAKHDPYLKKEHYFSQTFAKHPHLGVFHHPLISRIFRVCFF